MATGVTAIPIGATASINTTVPALSEARMINVLWFGGVLMGQYS
jgi:hypothetical protein